MAWLKSIGAALGGLVWLAVRFFRRRDAAEPQRKRDEIGKAVTTHNESKINTLLDDGLHRKPPAPD